MNGSKFLAKWVLKIRKRILETWITTGIHSTFGIVSDRWRKYFAILYFVKNWDVRKPLWFAAAWFRIKQTLNYCGFFFLSRLKLNSYFQHRRWCCGNNRFWRSTNLNLVTAATNFIGAWRNIAKCERSHKKFEKKQKSLRTKCTILG